MFRSICVSTFVVVTACGSGTGSGDPIDPDGGGVGADGHAPDDAAPQPTKSATVDVQLITPGFSETPETLITGGFVMQPLCARTTAGPCTVRRCEIGQHEVLAAPGKLHVSYVGGEYGWDPGANPLLFSADAIMWAAGESVKLRSEGELVPAFTTQTTSPTTLDAGYDGPRFNVPLPRTLPLHVTWNPSLGDVLVVLEQDLETSQETSHVTIECTATGPSGAVDVPVAALAKLSYTDGGILDDVDARTWHVNTASVTAGDYAVNLRVLRAYTDQQTSYKLSP